MKNVTLSADEAQIEKARTKARQQNTTLNALFRDWLARFVGTESAGRDYLELMKQLSYARAGGPFSRDELNER